MSNKPVALNLKKLVALPQVVILTAALRSKLGIDRRLTIYERQQAVPEAVREWMRSDKRYTDWFEADVPVAVADEIAMWSESMTTKELIEYARKHNVDVGQVKRKSDVIGRLREVLPIAERGDE